MSSVAVPGGNGKSFQYWQPIYAERGIALIPCGSNKAPLVKHPQKFGRDASTKIANKFSEASAFGYYCGKRNGITVLDVDTTDERVLSDALNRHGQTPIVVRSGSEKFHALYRFNNEKRAIRAWDGLPIDLLGAGLAIAPPSVVAKGQYQIIQGHLDDLDRLPIMCELDVRLYANASGPRPQRQGEGRNNDLWKRVMREAHHVDDFEQLLDRAETLNQEYVEPMPEAEVAKIATSAWGYTERGENRFGQHGAWFPEAEVDLLVAEQDAFILLAYLRAKQGPDSTFMITNGLSKTFSWGRQRLSAARELLIQRGYLRRLRHATNNSPALYRWLTKQGKGAENEGLVENRCLQMDTPTLAELRKAMGYRQ
jgi:Bifunctional DNA primase/polymerase, N-terminal/Primase C terminal 1 (PriCT-1)